MHFINLRPSLVFFIGCKVAIFLTACISTGSLVLKAGTRYTNSPSRRSISSSQLLKALKSFFLQIVIIPSLTTAPLKSDNEQYIQMTSTKNKKPLCFRWYKVLAAAAFILIGIIFWVFVIHPLIEWETDFVSPFFKKGTTIHKQPFPIDGPDSDQNIEPEEKQTLEGSLDREIVGEQSINGDVDGQLVSQSVDEKLVSKSLDEHLVIKDVDDQLMNKNLFFENNAELLQWILALLPTRNYPNKYLEQIRNSKLVDADMPDLKASTTEQAMTSYSVETTVRVYASTPTTTTPKPIIAKTTTLDSWKFIYSTTTHKPSIPQNSGVNTPVSKPFINPFKINVTNLIRNVTTMRPWIHHPAPTTTVPKIVSTTTLRPLTTSTKANVELNRTGSQLITNNLNSLNNYGYPKHIKNNDGKEYYPNSVIPNRNLHAKPIPRFDKIEPTPVFNEIKPIPIFNAIKPIENSNEMKAIHVEEEIKPIEIDFESGELFEGTIEPTSTTTAKDEVIKDKNKPSLFDSEDSLEFEETTTEIMPTTLPPIITTQKADINEKIIRSKRDAPVIVTALLDIGRGEWHSFYRPFNTYLSYLLDLLAIDNNMIIYGDKSVVDFVHKHYHHRLADKLVIEISLESLPFYRYKQEMSDIIAKEQQSWDPKWDKKMKNHPESVYADYNILVNSKPYLLSNATEISPFPSNEFIWIDGGYSHGDHNLIPKDTWFPFLIPGKVHVVKLTPTQDKINKYTLDTIYRKDLAVISGGVIAGDREAISRFYRFFYKNFVDMLDAHKADDDQTTMLMTIKHYASLFYIIHGGWFDAFRLLPNIDDPITMKDLKKAYHPQLAESTYPYFRIHNNRTRAKL